MVNGHGISHPRRLGIATHIGVMLDCPTIGVAKSILVGKPADKLDEKPRSHVHLIWRGQTIGMMVRTKKNSNPLLISTGYRICLTTAVELLLQSTQGYRLPEPTRQARLTANAYRRASSIFITRGVVRGSQPV